VAGRLAAPFFIYLSYILGNVKLQLFTDKKKSLTPYDYQLVIGWEKFACKTFRGLTL
jgi:hypothetical protein